MATVNTLQQWEEAIIRGADHFTSHLRVGPRKVWGDTHSTYAEARAAADDLQAKYASHGQQALVYAVTAAGRSTPISPAQAQQYGLA